MKFRKRPVIVDAIQWFPSKWAGDHRFVGIDEDGVEWTIQERGISTQEGFIRIHPGDWIITGITGEKYPCKEVLFKMTYEAVDESTP